MKQLKKTAQAGFTLIELIVVIVILGILAATALPKFMDLGGDARAASLNAAMGSVKTTLSMAHGAWLMKNKPSNVDMEGVSLPIDATSGYPLVADAATVLTAAGLSTVDYVLVPSGTTATPTLPGTTATQFALVPKSIEGTAKAVNCTMKVTLSTAANTAPAYTDPPLASAC